MSDKWKPDKISRKISVRELGRILSTLNFREKHRFDEDHSQ